MIFYGTLVPGLSSTCRDDNSTVMIGQVFRTAVDFRFVPVTFYNRRLEIVRNDTSWHPAKKLYASIQRIQKVGRLLAWYSCGVTIIGKRETGHKDLTIYDLTGIAIDIMKLLAGKVDIKFICRCMFHDHRAALLYFEILPQVETEL